MANQPSPRIVSSSAVGEIVVHPDHVPTGTTCHGCADARFAGPVVLELSGDGSPDFWHPECASGLAHRLQGDVAQARGISAEVSAGARRGQFAVVKGGGAVVRRARGR